MERNAQVLRIRLFLVCKIVRGLAHGQARATLPWTLRARKLLGERLLLGMQLVVQILLRKLRTLANFKLRMGDDELIEEMVETCESTFFSKVIPKSSSSASTRGFLHEAYSMRSLTGQL